MKRFSAVVRLWCLCLVACIGLVTFSFAKVDVTVARHFWKVSRDLGLLGVALGAGVILSLESGVVLALLLARLISGHLSRFRETLAIACLASICAYGINDQVLKPLFGVQPPAAVMHGARHAFDLAAGFAGSSFPSGHMVLAGAFAGVFMRLYRASVRPLAALLLIVAALLVVGDWHFLSDVIAGTFLGVSAGALAGEGWLAHVYKA